MVNAAVGFRGRCQDKFVVVELFCLEKYYLLLVTILLCFGCRIMTQSIFLFNLTHQFVGIQVK